MSSVSLFYGQNPWHYYITQALPILCASVLPYVASGWYGSLSGMNGTALHMLSVVVAGVILLYSCAGHKEWRFIHPVLPILHIFAAKSMADSFQSESTTKSGAPRANFFPIRKRHLALVLGPLPLVLYVTRYHGRGQIAVMRYLRDIPPSRLRSAGFLMPCHSTPWQSHLHRPELEGGYLWALGCEPPLRCINFCHFVELSTDSLSYLPQW
jgi:phosphatidylinositol glycan class B